MLVIKSAKITDFVNSLAIYDLCWNHMMILLTFDLILTIMNHGSYGFW